MNKRKAAALSLVIFIGASTPKMMNESFPAKSINTKSINTKSRATLSSDCFGYTHYPHKSTHFRTTVNVIAETICDEMQVTVQTKLSRKGWFIFRESVTNTVSARDKAQVNVSMKCKWKMGEPLIEYLAESWHSNQMGAKVETSQRRLLKC